MGRVTVPNSNTLSHKDTHTHTQQHLVWLQLFCSGFCNKRRASCRMSLGANRPLKAAVVSSQRGVERRKEDGNRSDWQRKSLALRPAPLPPPPPPRPAVPVLTATSHTLHLPSGSGRQRKVSSPTADWAGWLRSAAGSQWAS